MKRLVLSLNMIAMACGDDDAEDPTTNGDTQESSSDDSASTSMTDPTADDDSSSATTPEDGSSGESSDDGSTSSADSSGSDDSSGTTGAPVELEVSLSDAMAFMNCKPKVAPDPLSVSVTMFFDNPGDGIGTADVTAARLSTGGVEDVSFDLMPASFGPFDPNDMTTADATKVDGSAMPQNGCETLACGSDYDLEIVFDVDGTEVAAATTVTVMCGL